MVVPFIVIPKQEETTNKDKNNSPKNLLLLQGECETMKIEKNEKIVIVTVATKESWGKMCGK